MRSRIWPVMRKEFLHIWRDRRTLIMILLQPVIMLLLFGYALSSDVKHTPLAVWDQDGSPASRAMPAGASPACKPRPRTKQCLTSQGRLRA